MRQGADWVTRPRPATFLAEKFRAFEPSTRPFRRLPSRSFPLRIPDLSLLSPLLKPGQLLAPLVPAARSTRHAIYAVSDADGCAYVPAALLLHELWAWSASATDALLTPNSLALYLQTIAAPAENRAAVSGPLKRAGGSDIGLRRLCWLAQSKDAQASWSSALTFAHEGAIRLRLPRASLEGWAWGVEWSTGTLVAELSAVSLNFELPDENCLIELGSATHRCPSASRRRPGLVSF